MTRRERKEWAGGRFASKLLNQSAPKSSLISNKQCGPTRGPLPHSPGRPHNLGILELIMACFPCRIPLSAGGGANQSNRMVFDAHQQLTPFPQSELSSALQLCGSRVSPQVARDHLAHTYVTMGQPNGLLLRGRGVGRLQKDKA